jgi:hypothetical protein
MAIFSTRIARSHFMWLLTAQPIMRRECIRRMMFNSPMWITPLPPPLTALGQGSHGSVLSENHPPKRRSSR